jgi:hypothetical protein
MRPCFSADVYAGRKVHLTSNVSTFQIALGSFGQNEFKIKRTHLILEIIVMC